MHAKYVSPLRRLHATARLRALKAPPRMGMGRRTPRARPLAPHPVPVEPETVTRVLAGEWAEFIAGLEGAWTRVTETLRHKIPFQAPHDDS
jgi:hypothetical protein